MNATDYEAVFYDDAIYCVGCLPKGVTEDSEGVSPIFADSEWDYYPRCDECRAVHEYVSLTEYGRKAADKDAFDRLGRLASENNVEWWQSTITEVECDKCGTFDVELDRAHATAPPYCPSCEGTARIVRDTGRKAWFWWTCCPGCMPDSDMMGPFATERECLEDATDGLEE